ncbi:MAG: adenine phosphoribosyltransferase, partial [Paludibacter sp.]|nr:adenine phosphoribosyltransferase [Paludibacter sp.]
VVVLHDDLLATGGSAGAALKLLANFDTKAIYVSFMIELVFLKGRKQLNNVTDIHSMIHF